MSYVPEEVEFTNVNFTSLTDIINELSDGSKRAKIKVSGFDAMSVILYDKISSAVKDSEVENGDDVLYMMRLIKSPAEIEILKKVWEICDTGYKAILESELVGLTKIQAAATAWPDNFRIFFPVLSFVFLNPRTSVLKEILLK